jgi:hypothetical protein
VFFNPGMSLNEGVFSELLAVRLQRERRHAVRFEVVAFFAVVDRQNTGIEIEVMHPNTQAFRESRKS